MTFHSTLFLAGTFHTNLFVVYGSTPTVTTRFTKALNELEKHSVTKNVWTPGLWKEGIWEHTPLDEILTKLES